MIRFLMGRSVRTVQLDLAGNALASETTHYDTIVTLTGYCDVVQTTVTDGLGHSQKSRTDAAGRTLEIEDAETRVTVLTFDANGNRAHPLRQHPCPQVSYSRE